MPSANLLPPSAPPAEPLYPVLAAPSENFRLQKIKEIANTLDREVAHYRLVAKKYKRARKFVNWSAAGSSFLSVAGDYQPRRNETPRRNESEAPTSAAKRNCRRQTNHRKSGAKTCAGKRCGENAGAGCTPINELSRAFVFFSNEAIVVDLNAKVLEISLTFCERKF